MNKSQAMALISKICAGFKGNLADHQAIQEALKVIQDEVFPVSVQEPETLKPNFNKDEEKIETEDEN